MVGSIYNKVAGVKTCNFIKKRLQHRCFPVNITKFLRAAFLQNTSGGCFCFVCFQGGVKREYCPEIGQTFGGK